MRRALAAAVLAAALLLASGRNGYARGAEDSAFVLSLFVESYFAAWNRHDATALGRSFSDDAESTDTTGLTLHGSWAIMAAARAAFSDPFKDAQIHFVRIDSRSLAPGVVAIDVRWWIYGATAPQWERKQYGLSSWVAAKQRGQWRIVTAHEQLVSAPETPAPPTPSTPSAAPAPRPAPRHP